MKKIFTVALVGLAAAAPALGQEEAGLPRVSASSAIAVPRPTPEQLIAAMADDTHAPVTLRLRQAPSPIELHELYDVLSEQYAPYLLGSEPVVSTLDPNATPPRYELVLKNIRNRHRAEALCGLLELSRCVIVASDTKDTPAPVPGVPVVPVASAPLPAPAVANGGAQRPQAEERRLAIAVNRDDAAMQADPLPSTPSVTPRPGSGHATASPLADGKAPPRKSAVTAANVTPSPKLAPKSDPAKTASSNATTDTGSTQPSPSVSPTEAGSDSPAGMLRSWLSGVRGLVAGSTPEAESAAAPTPDTEAAPVSVKNTLAQAPVALMPPAPTAPVATREPIAPSAASRATPPAPNDADVADDAAVAPRPQAPASNIASRHPSSSPSEAGAQPRPEAEMARLTRLPAVAAPSQTSAQVAAPLHDVAPAAPPRSKDQVKTVEKKDTSAPLRAEAMPVKAAPPSRKESPRSEKAASPSAAPKPAPRPEPTKAVDAGGAIERATSVPASLRTTPSSSETMTPAAPPAPAVIAAPAAAIQPIPQPVLPITAAQGLKPISSRPTTPQNGVLGAETSIPLFVEFATVVGRENAWLEMNRLRMMIPSYVLRGFQLYAEPISREGRVLFRVAAAGPMNERLLGEFCAAVGRLGEECVVRMRR